MKKIAITGVTGFIGRGLAAMCKDRGIAVTGISRSGKGNVPGVVQWQTPDAMNFNGHDAVINLAGEPIDKRWTTASKKRFHESRVDFTNQVVAAIAACQENDRPSVLVSASAVGIYADRGDEILEESARVGNGYLADLCHQWEAAAMAAEAHGLRVATIRTGVVLGRDGRAWQKLHRLFSLGLGGRLGHGRQWMPWIHVDDLREIFLYAATHDGLRGAVNATTPEPLRNAAFTRELATSLHRPALFPAPAFALRLLLGEFASVLLASQRVVPAALESSGFQFRYPTLPEALNELNKPAMR
jgi:uncharacterized protein (TIGR01777 family)